MSFLAEQHLYPDAVVVMNVEVLTVIQNLIPRWTDKWRDKCGRKRVQMQLIKKLRSKLRVMIFALNVLGILMHALVRDHHSGSSSYYLVSPLLNPI